MTKTIWPRCIQKQKWIKSKIASKVLCLKSVYSEIAAIKQKWRGKISDSTFEIKF